MNVLLVIFSYMYCINQGSGYFFPICNSKDESCTSYFVLPNFHFLSSAKEQEAEGLKGVEQSVPIATDSFFESVDRFLAPTTVFYGENIQPLFLHIYNTASEYTLPLKDYILEFVKLVPFSKYEEKAKTDSRIYFLFIVTSLSIYLVLYAYFTRKLFYYYRGSLREQYLRGVKNIFKGPESSPREN